MDKFLEEQGKALKECENETKVHPTKKCFQINNIVGIHAKNSHLPQHMQENIDKIMVNAKGWKQYKEDRITLSNFLGINK